MGECGSEKNETKTSICQNQEDLGAAKSCPEQKACEAFTGPSLCLSNHCRFCATGTITNFFKPQPPHPQKQQKILNAK